MIVPSRSDSPRRILPTVSESVDDRPEVGSSRNKMPGLLASALPMCTRRFWPPEMPRTRESPMSESQTWSSCSALRSCSVRSAASACVQFVFSSV
mmetsp:Transcript_14047/g.37712  ORF Transcript_14047/g.37712 Transcript_14047/m.37712 type:complete len:95 (-) Transcript_14047:555-839(-)